MTSILRGWGVRQKRDVIGCRGWGLASVLDVQSFFVILKKIGFMPKLSSNIFINTPPPPPPPPPLPGRGEYTPPPSLPPWRGESEKLKKGKKRGGSIVVGGVVGGLGLFEFNFFKIYHFSI